MASETLKHSDSNPLVTIVTVTYNSSQYVRDAIEGVLAQGYVNLEYIIGDDCSADNTWQIINEYKDARIKAYRNETNLREYANRNKAISMATGKYLIFIDGDDFIYPHGVDFMVRMMEAFPTSAMAIMRPYHPKVIYPVELQPHALFVAEYFDKSLLDIAFTNTFFKTDILRDAGGLPTGYISGDTFIRLRIALKHSCILINDSLTWWRMTPGQASSNLINSVNAIKQYYDFKSEMLTISPLEKEERVLAFKNLQYKVLRQALSMLRRGRIMKCFQVLSATKLFAKVSMLLTYSLKGKDPFGDYSEQNPFRYHVSRNPHSNNTLK